ISRGCNNFIFRNNRSHNNYDPGSNLAHGFMLDPGGANIDKPQVSSSDNVLVDNEAYANEGYGIRVLGSSDNILRRNNFHHNDMGMSIDTDSDRNLIENNLVEENSRYGFYMRDHRANQLTENQINRNGLDGVNLNSSAKGNQLLRNTIAQNGGYGIEVRDSSSTGNSWSQNSIYGNQEGGIDDRVRAVAVPDLLRVVENRLEGAAAAGATVELFVNDSAEPQGARYLGSVVVDGSGTFTYVAADTWGGTHVTAVALDGSGNASAFSAPLAVADRAVATATATPTATVTPALTFTPEATVGTTEPTTPTPTATATPIDISPTVTLIPASTPTATATATATLALDGTPTATPTPASTPGGTGATERIYLPLILR
ncbi:MAG: right-handed parallel beta-helix repeat-containing protein, partial [Caldilineaceae bacterium]|nr:right-handed parallel beta-helix repeat-containing protein [Caldilineaceae bacterium]